MGRIYAGILGPLAMVVIICRGLKDSAGVEGTLTLAIVALAVYAIIGSVLGADRPGNGRRIGASEDRAAVGLARRRRSKRNGTAT